MYEYLQLLAEAKICHKAGETVVVWSSFRQATLGKVTPHYVTFD